MEESVYIYEFASNEEERLLCRLEQRALFGRDTENGANLMVSAVRIDPSRSPFIKERIEVLYQGNSLEEVLLQVEAIKLAEATFKVIFVKLNDLEAADKISYEDQRSIERELGIHITGEADVRNPDFVFGIVALGGCWYFGNYLKNKAVWLLHMKKPRNYSIALTTRLARAAANMTRTIATAAHRKRGQQISASTAMRSSPAGVPLPLWTGARHTRRSQ